MIDVRTPAEFEEVHISHAVNYDPCYEFTSQQYNMPVCSVFIENVEDGTEKSETANSEKCKRTAVAAPIATAVFLLYIRQECLRFQEQERVGFIIRRIIKIF
ncbi:hypothetical protein [Ectobacillus panaciterrae]|uniref:hypothetical protein n=1 Tax=Ectobacillus panaciterrae TaxID=363872 RepID=UPI003CCBE159